MREATLKELAIRMKQQKSYDHNSTVIFIGAGCSISAGIPACAGMTLEMETRFGELLKGCKEKNYATYMGELTPSERKIFLEGYIRNAKLNLTHIFLASLVKNEFVDCVITTNFDNLALKALTKLNVFPAVYDLASSSEYISGMLNFPSVVYLHGQHTGWWQMNTDDEMKSVKESIARAFDEILRDRTLIFIGYGGNDPVLDVLSKISRFNHKAYWVSYKDKGIPEHVEKSLFNDARKSIYHIPGFDSDKFFFNLHNELAITPPDLFAHPFKHLEETYSLISNDLKVDEKQIDIREDARKQIEEVEKYLADKESGGTRRKSGISVEDLRARTKESWLNWKKKDPDSLFTEVVASNDRDAKAYLAYAYLEKGDNLDIEGLYEQAIAQFDKAIKLIPDEIIGYHNRGLTYGHLENHQLAIADWTKVLELKSDNFDAYNNRGVSYKNIKKYDLALLDYNNAIMLRPNDASPYVNRGVLYDVTGQMELALKDYIKAVELSPRQSVVYSNRGVAYTKMEQYNLALADFNKAIELDPYYSEAYNNRGKIYMNKNDYKLALVDCNKAIELKPDNIIAYINRGSIYDTLKKYDLALLDYSKALSLNPDLAAAYNNRATTYRSMGELDLAFEDVKKALSLDPEDGHFNATLAEIYAVQGKSEEFYQNIAIALEKGCSVREVLDDSAYDIYKNEPRFLELLKNYKKH